MRSISTFDRAVNTTLAPFGKFGNACFANPATGACDQNGFPDKSIAQSLVNMALPTMAQGGKPCNPLNNAMNCHKFISLRRKGFYVSTINFIYRTVGWVIWCIGRSCRFNGRSRWAQTIDLIEEAGGSITALAHGMVTT